MEDNIKRIIIGIIIFSVLFTLGSCSIVVGAIIVNTRSKETKDKPKCDKFCDYKLLKNSNEKITVIGNVDRLKVDIPSNVCVDKKLRFNIINGNVDGDSSYVI